MSFFVFSESAASQRRVVLFIRSSRDLARQFDGANYVLPLGSFVAAAQENGHDVAAAGEIEPVAWTIVDPHLHDALSDRLRITGIAERKTAYPRGDPGPRLTILKLVEPCFVDVGLPNLNLHDCLL